MMTPPVLLQLPQDLATAYNFGGVTRTVHCLFQLLIEHKLSENNWILATVKGLHKSYAYQPALFKADNN